jgi:hypothetical protein
MNLEQLLLMSISLYFFGLCTQIPDLIGIPGS